MRGLKGIISHHQQEVHELKKDRGLAVEYLLAAIAAFDQPDERAAGLLAMLALAEAYSDLEELSAVAGISQESLARMHGFIVEAIVEKAESELVRAELDSEADARLAKVLTLGATIPWSEMRPYLENRLAGKNGNPPAQQSMIANAEARMTTNLVLQNVDAGLALALKQRAAEHGLSAEAEHHEILRNALQGPQRRPFAEVLASMPDVGEDADFDARNG